MDSQDCYILLDTWMKLLRLLAEAVEEVESRARFFVWI
jgi:hypothetical protein